MDTATIDTATVVDLFLLLLIGIGPKIALLPYLEATAGLDAGDKRRIVRTMLTTASVVALILVVFGELLRRLLHFSTGALAIAGGILLLIIAVTMVLGTATRTSTTTPTATRTGWRCSRWRCPTS